MLKSWNEMRKIDVLPFCDKRDAKDDNGRKIEVPYRKKHSTQANGFKGKPLAPVQVRRMLLTM